MKVAFRFFNGTSELILTPENNRDKQCLYLCMDGRHDMKLKPTTQEWTIIEFTESKPTAAVAAVPVAVVVDELSLEENT